MGDTVHTLAWDDEETFDAPVHADVRISELDEDVRRAVRLANMLDAQFSVMGFKFGFDAIVGLAPVIGDALGFLAGLYPIHVARKHKLGRLVEQRMIANLLLDCLVGVVPIVGDLFDAAFKANLKNAAMLQKAARRAARKR